MFQQLAVLQPAVDFSGIVLQLIFLQSSKWGRGTRPLLFTSSVMLPSIMKNFEKAVYSLARNLSWGLFLKITEDFLGQSNIFEIRLL